MHLVIVPISKTVLSIMAMMAIRSHGLHPISISEVLMVSMIITIL